MINDSELPALREHFEKYGFVKIKNVLTPEIIELYKSFIDITQTSDTLREVETGSNLTGNIERVAHNIFDDSILLYCKHLTEQIWGIDDMVPSYAYSREYYHGSELLVHRDREACQYSLTLTMCKRGQGNVALWFSEKDDKSDAIPVELEEGDAIIFNGGTNYGGKWHWRDALEIDSLVQLFLHYVHQDNTSNAQFSFPRPNYRSR
jgi:hypothetical protein